MEPVLSFNVGFRNAARLVFVVGSINSFKIIRQFSAQKKLPLLEEQQAGKTSKQGVTCLQAGHSLATSGLQGMDSNPPPGEESHKANTLQDRSWRKFRAQAVPSSSKEEFRNLRKDDFTPKRPKLRLNPPPLERTKGTEILFGTAPCSLALGRSKRTISQLFLKSSRDGASPPVEKFSQYAKERGIPVKVVPRMVLNALCKGRVHQGVCLEATPLRPLAWQEGPLRRAGGGAVGEGLQSLWLVLEGICDPMNLGAVLRSAHFLGVDGIVLNKRNTCPLTPVVSKASAGFMEVFDVFSTDDLQGLLKAKSDEGWEVLGTVGHTKIQEEIPVVNCLNFHWTRPTILLLGNEGYGLSPETRKLCHRMLTVTPGRELEFGVESLNVSVAAGMDCFF